MSVIIAQMHSVSPAVAPMPTVLAVSCPSPVEGAMWLVAVFPDVHEFVLIDVALVIIGADAGTGGNGTICHNAAHGDARLAMEEMVADVAFVVAEETFAAETGLYGAIMVFGVFFPAAGRNSAD